MSNTRLFLHDIAFETKRHTIAPYMPSGKMGSKDPRDITPPKKGDKAPDTPNHDAQAREEADIQSTNAPSVHHVSEKEQEQPAAQKKRQKAWLHCRRFYLWYLLGVIIFLIIFLPLL